MLLSVANENGQIQSFPRRFLDPRRPKHKPTAEESEEWLIQYDAVLPDDPKRVLSHQYQVRPSVPNVKCPSRRRIHPTCKPRLPKYGR